MLKKDFVVAKCLKFRLVQQGNKFIQTGAYTDVLFQQLFQRQIFHTLLFDVRLAAAVVVGQIRSQKLQCAGNDPSGRTHADDAHRYTGQLQRMISPTLSIKAVEQANQLRNNIFPDPDVSIIGHTIDGDAMLTGTANIHAGTAFIVQTTTHPDVAQLLGNAR